jgi:hypothetical protein
MVRNQGRVTRFVVMATLQAARAQSLGLSRDSAYSWGLNRAIFYAAAKRGFSQSASATVESSAGSTEGPRRESFRLGEEEAYRDLNAKELTFTIGEEAQTAEMFERQVISRFGTTENFRTAWDEAVRIVGGHDRATLESQRGFYEDVYKPRRDELSDSWTQRFSPPPKTKAPTKPWPATRGR